MKNSSGAGGREAKVCCWHCYRTMRGGQEHFDSDFNKTFCSVKCANNYGNENKVWCPRWSMMTAFDDCRRAFFRDEGYRGRSGMLCCSEECSVAIVNSGLGKSSPEPPSAKTPSFSSQEPVSQYNIFETDSTAIREKLYDNLRKVLPSISSEPYSESDEDDEPESEYQCGRAPSFTYNRKDTSVKTKYSAAGIGFTELDKSRTEEIVKTVSDLVSESINNSVDEFCGSARKRSGAPIQESVDPYEEKSKAENFSCLPLASDEDIDVLAEQLFKQRQRMFTKLCDTTKPCHMAPSEVAILYDLFKRQCRNSKMRMDPRSFTTGLRGGWGVQNDDLANRLFGAFDIDGDRSIDFKEFVRGLSVMIRGTLDEVTEFVWRVISGGKQQVTKECFCRVIVMAAAASDVVARRTAGLESDEDEDDERVLAAHRLDANTIWESMVESNGTISRHGFIDMVEKKRWPQVLRCVGTPMQNPETSGVNSWWGW